MNSFAFLLLCFSACLIQATFSYPCAGPTIPSCGVPRLAPSIGSIGSTYAGCGTGGSFGGQGAGTVSLNGQLDVTGSTRLVGIIPVLGSVKFAGEVPAVGSGTVTGSCGCGCNYMK